MKPKKPISHIAAGLIIGVALVLFSMITYFTGTEVSGSMAWVPIFLLIGGLIAFVNLYGNAMNNEPTFGNLFGYGFKTTAVITLLVIACTVILALAVPEFRQHQFDVARQKMIEKGTMSNDEIDKGIEFVKKMYWTFTIGGILLIYAIVGAIGSVFGAAVTKKRPARPENQLNF